MPQAIKPGSERGRIQPKCPAGIQLEPPVATTVLPPLHSTLPYHLCSSSTGLAEPEVQNKKVSDIPLLYRSQPQWGALCGCPPGLGPCDAGGLGAALQTPARDSGVEDFTGVPDSKFCPRTLGSLPALAFNMLKITEVIGGFSDSLVHPVGGHLTFREVCV